MTERFARAFADAEVLANALEYFRAGRIAEAEAAYVYIFKDEPDHFICLHYLWSILDRGGEHTAAARLIEQALAIKPDYIEALSNLAAIYRALGDRKHCSRRRGRRSPCRLNSRKPNELFERHDKSCFEIVAYSHGADDCGELSARLRAAFDDCGDIRAMTDTEAARRITADGIDILVELKGYTKGARTGIAARKWAPVQ